MGNRAETHFPKNPFLGRYRSQKEKLVKTIKLRDS